MVNACSYCGKKRAPGRVLYRIPFLKNEEQAKKWIESMNLGPGFDVLPNFMLCSEHFEKDCYYNIRGMEHRLKPGCVPTKFGVFIRLCISCKSKRSDASKTFHFFPLKNSTQFEKWVTAVGCNGSDITRNTVLCSDHFEKSCYYNLLPAYKMRLRELSVPTIFNTFRSSNSEEVQRMESDDVTCLNYFDMNEVSQSTVKDKISDESDPLSTTDSTMSTRLSTFNLKEVRVLLEHCDPFTYNNFNTTKDNLNVKSASTVEAFPSKLQPEIGIVKRSPRKRKQIFNLKDIIPSIISDEEDDDDDDCITVDNDHKKSTSLSNVKKVNSNERYPKKTNCKRVINIRDSKPPSCTVNKNENSASPSVNFVKVIAEEPTKMSSHCVSEKGEEKPIVKTVVRVSTEKICRICGKISDSLEPIFNRNIAGVEETDVPVLIHSHLPIMVNESDVGWPKNICDLCVQVLTGWDKLYKTCVYVDAKFNQMFKKFTTQTTTDNVDIKNEELPQRLSVSLNGHDYAEKNLLQNVHNKSVNDNNKENEVLTESEKKSKTKEFKIGLKIVKENDCKENNPAAELDLSSLKTILSTKVNQLFQSICNDEVIGKSLIGTNLNDTNNDISGVVKQTNIENNDDNVVNLNKLKRSKTTRKSKRNVIKENKSVRKRRKSDTTISKNNDDDVKFDIADDVNKDKINNGSENINNEDNLNVSLNKLKQKKNQYKKPVLCYECGKLSTSRLCHVKHRSSYHEQRKCEYCDLVFCGMIEYKKHLKIIHHEKLMVNCCELCGARFIKDEQLNAHKLRMHNIGDYHHCDLCDKKYPTRLGLLNHKSDVHPQKECICQLCDKKFTKRTSLKDHLKVVHGASKFLAFKCFVCHRVFPNSMLHQKHCLAKHMDVLTSEQLSQLLETASKVYFCIICGIRSTNIELLIQHMSCHENDDDVKRNLCGQDEVTKFRCVICGKYLNTKKDLGSHRYYAHKEPPFSCTVFGCRKSFWKQSLVEMHYSSEHKGGHVHDSKITYDCPSCPATFSNHLMKARHFRNFHNVDENGVKRKKVMKTPYACETCGKRFNSKYILSMHLTSHSNVKHHKCPHCNRMFKLQFTLRKHLLSHEKRNDTSKNEQNHSTKERLETIISEAVEKDKDEIVLDNKQQVFEEIVVEQEEVFDENVIQHKVDDVYEEQFTEDNLIVENTVTVFDENQLSLKPTIGVIDVSALFKCSYCELLFQDRSLLEKHCHEIHRDENYGLEIFS